MTKVKICGITNVEDALLAVEYGADALGFIFAPSPRKVTPEEVKEIVSKLPPFISKVGVFADNMVSEIKNVMSFCGLDLAQLHGGESPGFCALLFPKAIKAIMLENFPPLLELERYNVVAFLLDREKKVASPENCKQITNSSQLWQRAKEIRNLKPVILGGGLNPENVGQAIKVAQPYAVDVARGVEELPGKKDRGKLREFIETVKRES